MVLDTFEFFLRQSESTWTHGDSARILLSIRDKLMDPFLRELKKYYRNAGSQRTLDISADSRF